MTSRLRRRDAWGPDLVGAAVTAGGLLLLLAWEVSGLDLVIARAAGGAGGFPVRDHWLATTVLHDGARLAAWAVAAWLLAGLASPTGVLRPLGRARISWLLATAITAMLLVAAAKRGSATSCPWDLQQFGGAAAYVPHWDWGRADGGAGHCFPAGPASGGFGWVAGYCALRDVRPRAARRWLAGAVAGGLAMGVAQQWRGAHFSSHTFWTAWTCWTWSWACSTFLPAAPAHGLAAGG